MAGATLTSHRGGGSHVHRDAIVGDCYDAHASRSSNNCRYNFIIFILFHFIHWLFFRVDTENV